MRNVRGKLLPRICPAPKLKRGKKEMAGGTIYQGTAGISIFLSELSKITGDRIIENTARGAIEFALSEAEKLPSNSFGFHSGRTGIAYSTILFSSYTNDNDLQQRGLKLLEALKGRENEDNGLACNWGCRWSDSGFAEDI